MLTYRKETDTNWSSYHKEESISNTYSTCSVNYTEVVAKCSLYKEKLFFSRQSYIKKSDLISLYNGQWVLIVIMTGIFK